MVQNVNPTFVKTPNVQVTQITTGAGIAGGFVTIYTGGVNGSKVVGCTIAANTSATQDVRIAVVSSGSVTGYINTVSVPTTAGFASANIPVNGLSNILPVDSDGNPFVFLASSATLLQAQTTTNSSQWTAANFISFTVSAGDF